MLALLTLNDPNKFIPFIFPSVEERVSFWLKRHPTAATDEVRKFVQEELGSQRKNVLASFAEVGKQAAADGCDLTAASFGECNTDIPTLKGLIKVIITASGRSYQIDLDDRMFMNGRWYIIERDRISRTHYPRRRRSSAP